MQNVIVQYEHKITAKKEKMCKLLNDKKKEESKIYIFKLK